VTVFESFRTAVETQDLAAMTSTLDPDIEFSSPVMVKPYRGKDRVAAFLGVLLEVFEEFHYTGELIGPASYGTLDQSDGPPTQALVFNARVMGKEIHGLDLLTFNDADLIANLTVMVRPLPAAMTLARVVGKRTKDIVVLA
jgi:SnoaL-like domain